MAGKTGYNGQNATALSTPPRSHNAVGGRIAVPNTKPIPESVLSLPDDFWARVDVDMYDSDACFPWKGGVNNEGYGRYYVGGRHWYAHRVAFTLTRGQIPDDLTIDHRCSNRRCCNPSHMEPVTASVNVARRKASVTTPTSHKLYKRPAARYARRRERGLCVQCNTPSDKYRCDRCREAHNARTNERRSKDRG